MAKQIFRPSGLVGTIHKCVICQKQNFIFRPLGPGKWHFKKNEQENQEKGLFHFGFCRTFADAGT